jgi:hypothetical protein
MNARPYSVTKAEAALWQSVEARDLASVAAWMAPVRRATVDDYTAVTYETVDARGELRLEAMQGTPVLEPASLVPALLTRDDAWAVEPHCLVCGTAIPSASAAAMVQTAQGHRVACAVGPCFRRALVAIRLVPLMPSAVEGR